MLNLTYFFSIDLLGFIFSLILISILIFFHEKDYKKIFILFYFSFPYFLLVHLRFDESFIDYILFIVIFSIIVDVSAFFVGKTIGGKKLAEKLSPNKTIAGMVGGIIIPSFICVVFFIQYSSFNEIIFLSIFFSIIAQTGDLIESKFKRFCYVKDSSNIIPGHGGVLDRLDSIFLLTIFISIFKLFNYNFFFVV
jgi:phosphatidate cytidylyltransferase